MMNEIKIRGLDDVLLAKIDRLAMSKKQSRQEYLSMILRRLTEAPFLVEQATNYMEVERLLLETIEINNQLLQVLVERLEW
jgi:hypothetical protein